MLKKVMHILFLSCLKATELTEKKLYFNLSVIEKIQLKMHKIICKPCEIYEKHSQIIEKGISVTQLNNKTLLPTEELRKKILAKISGS